MQCPLPKLDFDVITLGHGSGGLLTNKLLDEVIFPILGQPFDEQHDGVILPTDAPIACSTDSFVVSPIFFPGGNIGDLAVNGTLNDLAMCGATPEYITLSLIIEEGLTIDELWRVLVSIKNAADHGGVKIITGDTKVVDHGKADKLFINSTGIGRMIRGANISAHHIKPGDCILVSGSIANHGMAIMSTREGLTFESSIESDTRSVHRTVEHLIYALGNDVRFLRDPTRGGVATVLNEVAKSGSIGIELDQEALPVKNQVLSACELFGLDPLFVANEGIFVTIVDESMAQVCLEILQADQVESALIGKVTSDHSGKVLINNSLGGKRVINMLPGDQLPRIC